jgi:hypothetical protein
MCSDGFKQIDDIKVIQICDILTQEYLASYLCIYTLTLLGAFFWEITERIGFIKAHVFRN